MKSFIKHNLVTMEFKSNRVTVRILLISLLFSEIRSESAIRSDLGAELNALFKNRCAYYGSNFTSIEEILSDFIQCTFPHGQLPESFAEIIEQFCAGLSNQLYNCLDDFLNKTRPCLDENEQYLPGILLGFFNSSLEQNCRQDYGGKKLEVLKNATCKKNANFFVLSAFQQCSEMRMFDVLDDNSVYRKSDLCRDLEAFPSCSASSVREYCEDDTLSGLMHFMVRPFAEWCWNYPDD